MIPSGRPEVGTGRDLTGGGVDAVDLPGQADGVGASGGGPDWSSQAV